MIYIKSFVAGLVSVVFCAVALVVSIIVVLFTYRPKGNGSIGFDLTAFAKPGIYWIIAASAFIAGFIWEFHRAG